MSVCTVHFEVGENVGCIGIFFDEGDTDAVADERKAVAVSGADFAADDVTCHEQNFADGWLFEHEEGLDESDEPCGAALGDIHAEEVMFKFQASLDDVCGGGHEVVGGLSEHEEGIEFVWCEQILAEEELDAGDGEVGNAGAIIDDAMFVVSHDFGELLGAFAWEAAGDHVIDEAEGSFGQYDVDPGDFFACEAEVHCGAPLRRRRAWIA